MTCPRCGSLAIQDLLCAACRMAWPTADYLVPTHALYRAAKSRWRKWTLERRHAATRARETELIGG